MPTNKTRIKDATLKAKTLAIINFKQKQAKLGTQEAALSKEQLIALARSRRKPDLKLAKNVKEARDKAEAWRKTA